MEVPHAVIEWSALALRARLNALCAPGAPVEAAQEALAQLARHRAAGLLPEVEDLLVVLRAAAAHGDLRTSAIRLFEELAAARHAQGTDAPAEACALVLPLYEAAQRWREALNLPHVQPSAYAFSRALELECDQERWLRIAESTRSLRFVGQREAAVARWREEIVAGRGPGKDELVRSAPRSSSPEDRLRLALRRVLQLDPVDLQQEPEPVL